MVVCSNLGLCE